MHAAAGAAQDSSLSGRRVMPAMLRRMTNRLYYNDPYSREFDASVVRVEQFDGRTHVRLDRTAFYPTSGGQPFDLGRLDAFRVVDVIDDEGDGDVVHVIEAAGDEAAAGRQGSTIE